MRSPPPVPAEPAEAAPTTDPVSPAGHVGGRRGWLVVAAVTLLAFFVVRVPLLLPEPQWGTMEHHEFGLFASHLVSGLVAPPADYLAEPHQGCTFLFGLGCAPVIALVGPTVGGLRLCSLLLHAAIALIFAVVARRVWGLRAGLAEPGQSHHPDR